LNFHACLDQQKSKEIFIVLCFILEKHGRIIGMGPMSAGKWTTSIAIPTSMSQLPVGCCSPCRSFSSSSNPIQVRWVPHLLQAICLSSNTPFFKLLWQFGAFYPFHSAAATNAGNW
jgi:hypothetical protein